MTARVLAGNPPIQPLRIRMIPHSCNHIIILINSSHEHLPGTFNSSVFESPEPLPITSSPICFNDGIITALTTTFHWLIRALNKMESHHDDLEKDSFKPSVSDDLDSEVTE
ncbi:hypothetical protein I7I51_07376 [Histoplasma capsulatum]|uniref:Uncharacterized protein n=1 Tax=Ajellomyces capsulatus TaxID=5037 RepID=A0A8A1M187_AJECA|nr:hypothetical protein I7I51_07376 [Histoplasma capsulatum]